MPLPVVSIVLFGTPSRGTHENVKPSTTMAETGNFAIPHRLRGYSQFSKLLPYF